VVKKRFGYLGRAGGPWEIWEPLWWSAERESLGRPDRVWGGRGQEVRPVCFLGRGNGLEISSSRAFDIAPVERGGVKARQPCEPVILPSKGRQAGGPPCSNYCNQVSFL